MSKGWEWLEEIGKGDAMPLAGLPPVASGQATDAGEAGFVVPLLDGKRVVGPFAKVDDDGGPMVEVYQMIPGTDENGRACMKPAWLGEVSRDVTRAELVEAQGHRWYRLTVRGADGRRLTGGDVDLRRPEDHNRQRVGQLAGLAAGEERDGRDGWEKLDERVTRAVERARAEMKAAHELVTAAVERERAAWEKRAVEAEKAWRAAADEVQKLRLDVLEARLTKGSGGGLDFDQARAVLEKARDLQDRVNELLPAASAPEQQRDLGASMLDGLRAFKTGVGEIVGIAELVGVKVPSMSTGGGFSLPRV